MFNSLDEVENEAKNCNKCNLCQNRKKNVFSNGNKEAKIMFIAETEEKDGWLDKIFGKVNLENLLRKH